MVIFPSVNVIQVLLRGVYAVLPLTSPLEVFCTISTVFVCMDLVRGLHQTLSKNKYNYIYIIYLDDILIYLKNKK